MYSQKVVWSIVCKVSTTNYGGIPLAAIVLGYSYRVSFCFRFEQEYNGVGVNLCFKRPPLMMLSRFKKVVELRITTIKNNIKTVDRK